MPAMKKIVLAVAAVVSVLSGAASAQQLASETVRVSVTLPVNVPLEVPAGKSFKDAAAEFCERNGLAAVHVDTIEQALEARWQEMQAEHRVRDQCIAWQLSYGVAPNKSWGTMPNDLRVEWLEKSCDTLVPADPPAPLVSMYVSVGDNSVVTLRAFAGDTVGSAVERFCSTHGIDLEANESVLVEALAKKIEDMRAAQAQPPAEKEEQQKAGETEQVGDRKFLFSIPFQVDGVLARLRVHEGDDLEELVRVFCNSQNLSIAEYGAVVRKAIIDTSAEVTKQLEQELMAAQQEEQQQQQQAEQAQSKTGVEESSDPLLLLDVPISVDGVDFSMKLYDGDIVNHKITAFCKEHNLDEAQHGALLLNHIRQRTEALRNN
ncbi:Hypothetical Protein FCC1311_079562 [Hondaea fermentalgiana]|uniref:Peptidylprolyl isomerase n=1 Tax=Hondaea fermentalgiana TaxID=2315210 RepID=A0A2R5GTL7_9STRA|nr:Hypothetical Protein FCC1311_079562 [Hondaea fermentalgiana]|eukprot:GBG31731.1 Hypothetical Protein FCC1311_079562 [Hondaea fermentalgiana]